MMVPITASLLLSFVIATEGVVPVQVERVKINHDGPHGKMANTGGKTGGSVVDVINNQRYYYTTNVEIGTPAQRLNLILDTGSSDTWVFGPGTSSKSPGGIGSLFGGNRNKPADTTIFDSSKSSTWHPNGTQWQIAYGRGSAEGEWGTDTFSIGGTKLNALTIGVAHQVSQISTGLIGLGRPQAESTAKSGVFYRNLPQQLKAEGKINSAAYSLFMNDVNSKQGTILFGGVDHSKYTGPLASLPVAHPEHLAVGLQGLYGDGRSTGNNLKNPMVAILDSGTSLSYFPADILTNIRVTLNANPSFAIGEKYYCDCNITSNLIFDYGNVKIKVPAYQFLWPITDLISETEATTFFPQNSCYLGIEQSSGSTANDMLLGDNILRSMYVVYDLDNNQIAVAQANMDPSTPRVQAITGNGRIPGSI